MNIEFEGDGTSWLGPIWSTSRSPIVRFGRTEFFRPSEGQPKGKLLGVQFQHFKDPLHDPTEIRRLSSGLLILAGMIDGG